MRSKLLILAAYLGLCAGANAQEPARYDVVIRGGRVLDGTGNPVFHADVAIDDGIRYVLINGKFAVDSGELTGALAGGVLTPRASSLSSSR